MAGLSPFERAVAHTLGIEGGYSDHPSDRGGKTNWGITEQVARDFGYQGPMEALPKATALDIYRKLYWERIGLDWVALVDEQVALEVFDTGVNQGVGYAVRYLQRVLNALNRQGRDYPDIAVDGSAGPKTRDAMRALYRLRGAAGRQVLLTYLNALQGARYIDLAEARLANEDFIFGWAQRVKLPAADRGAA
ncbi:MAG: hypothetical protein K2X73_04820 [Sphingomonas sp.]|uniref:glycoside hydrolase family 108 protein n=1 Tax=Sphingomonas sp. TaxID=28214 RepID=UPI0025FBFBD9|nr:glycosyl hydrolase 108 family protein [Sphingomonas sp.]MBX9881277.1 hypothetical protein [Sphingomonas sp.]